MAISLHEEEPGPQEAGPGHGKPGPQARAFRNRGFVDVLGAAASYPKKANFRINARARMYMSGLIFLNFPLIMLIRT